MSTNFSELGVSGLLHDSGYIREEFLRELQGVRWQRNVKEMTWNDPVVAAAFFAIEMLTRQVTWDIQSASNAPEDEAIAQFVRECMDDMSQPWTETIAEIHSYLPWGWSYHELVYKRRTGENRDPSKNSKFTDGRIGWRKWPIRAQDSLSRWDLDDNGGVQGMYQRAAPRYDEVLIPIERALLFRTSQHKNNPEGRSLCRPIFRPWFFKTKIENFEAIGIERDLAGLPMMKIPQEFLDPRNDQSVANYCKDLVTGVRADEQGGILIGSDVFAGTNVPKWEFSLVSAAGTKQFDTNKVIQRKNIEILITLMADFIMLGHEKVGSFALSSDKTNMFATAIGAFLDSDCEVVSRHAIPRLLRINGMPAVNPPKLTHGDIESVDLVELGDFISKLSGAGVSLNPEILGYTLEQAGLPVPEDEAELAQMVAPKPAPVPFGVQPPTQQPSKNGKSVPQVEEA